MRAPLAAVLLVLVPAAARASESVPVEAAAVTSLPALTLNVGAIALYGRRTAGVGGSAGLGVLAGEETYYVAQLDVGVGQMIGHPGDWMLHAESVGIRGGILFIGAEHRGALRTAYSYWGGLAGVHLPVVDDSRVVGLALRFGVGYGQDTRSVDWNLGAALEIDIGVR